MIKMYQPLVSILINNYNNAPYIKECIDSCLNQSYHHIEIIVYDDGSTDASQDIIASYGDKIKAILKQENFGSSPNFNQANAIYQAFKISKGEIICLLDGDDKFHPNKVSQVVEAFQKNDDTIMVQNLFTRINENNKILNKRWPENIILPKKIGYKRYKDFIIEHHCLQRLFMQTSALSFRRFFLEKELPIMEDKYNLLWPDFRLSRKAVFQGKILTLTQPLSYYRIHNDNWIHSLKGSTKKEVERQIYNFMNERVLKNRKKLNYKIYRLHKWLHPTFWKLRIRKNIIQTTDRLNTNQNADKP